MNFDPSKYVSGPVLLERLFNEDCRPKPRTLRRWVKARVVPVVRVGRLVFYDVDKCREALVKKKLIRSI